MEVPWRGVLLLALLSCCSPIFADASCKSCKGVGGPFVEGQVYKYQLEGSTVTNLPGSPSEVTSLKVTATAEVFAESKCQHVLKLSDVKVSGPDGKSYDGLAADCAKPIKFSYNEGKLSELCGAEDDRGAALNIKRAVVSLLSSLKRKEGGSDTGYEHDVFGICPTDFTFTKDGTKLTIQKNKNLNRCALREEFNFPFPSTTYQAVQSSFGAFETSPLLGAHLTVQQELDNGVLQKATGEEVYDYRPMVNPEAGATVKVSYTLTLQGASAGSIPVSGNSPKTVYYQAAHDDDGVKNSVAISEALQQAVAALEPVATPEAAKRFSHLVYVIEQGSKGDILQTYTSASGKTAKNLFLDGLFYAGSADSVEAAAELLSSKQIPEGSALRWYLDLNFVKHASRGSLKALLPLLSGDKVPHQAYIGIGAVAGKFCLQHRQLCETSPEFKELQEKLAAPLAAGCKVDSHDKENTVIASLKGLRNTRHLTDSVAQKVATCALDKTAKSRVRVAAIEAFHAEPSKPVVKEAAKSVLKDVEEDSELRIKAYLSLVECPCPKTADTIKDLIDNEPINQVGAFVVSHLRNLRASVSPDKEAAKQFFGNIIPKKKFPIDQRKFSRNYEVSYSLDAVNVGAVGEVNRIFSQKSFIPRSVSLNLTTQLFGHSINLAEVGLRAENLDWHLEKWFGPQGLLSTKGAKVLDDIGEKAEETIKKAKEQVENARPKRSVNKQETDAATDKVNLGPDYEDRYTDLDLSVKLFGSDIGWLNYHYEKVNYNDLKKKLSGKLDETLDKSKSIDIDYKKGRKFLDAGVTYPTGLGFSLKVKVDGNSAVNIKVNGKFDLKAILSQPKNAHIAFQVVPSANIELTSVLSVDAHIVEAGVKVSANLHSATGTDLTVKVLDGYGVDVKLGLPIKKQEVLNFNSDVVSIVRENKGAEVESPVKFNVKRQDTGGCFDQLSPLTGLTFCGELSVPLDGLKVLSPAYGPSKASLRLEKDDESLTSYHFKAFYNNKQPDQIGLEVLLDTPNSKTNRKFSLTAEGSLKPKKQLLVTLITPFKQATFEGLVIDTDAEQAVSAKLVSDGAEYSFKAGAHVSGDANRKKYEPLLEYKYPESGKSDRAWIGRKGSSKSKPQQSTVGVTGAVFVEKNPTTPYRKYELKAVTLTTPRVKVTLDGTITIDSNQVATDLKATYDKETFTLNSNVQKLEAHKYIAKIEFAPSQYPDFGGSIKWEYEKQPNKIENKLVVVHGPDLKSETSRVSVSQLLTYKYENIKLFDFHTENTVTYPLLGITAAVKGGATPRTVNYDVDVTYEKTQVKSKLDAKAGGKHASDYSVDFEAKALSNSVVLSSKHERVSATKSKLTNSLELKPGGKYQLNALAELNAKTGDVFQSLDAEVKFPQEPKIIKLKTELKHNNKEEEVEFELTAGNKKLVDFEFELHKKSEPSGKYKLTIHKIVVSEGSFETKDSKATGQLSVDVVRTGRKIEGKGELTKAGSQVKGFGTIAWDVNKDPSKKIHIETDTTYQYKKSVDSKNKIQVLDYETDVNVKGEMEGALNDGKLNGQVELVLPGGRSFIAKVDRELHIAPEDNKIEGTWELWEIATKGAEPRKLVLKVAGKNINPAKIQFDGQVDLSYTSPTKQDVILHLVGKKVPQGDKWAISGQGSLTGSYVKKPLEAKLNAEVAEQLIKGQLTPERKFPPGHYDLELKAGSDITLTATGKVNLDQVNNEIELKLPADLPVTQFKWKSANTLNLYVPEGSSKKVVTDNTVHWNGDKFAKLKVESVVGDHEGHGTIVWESDKLAARTLTYKANVNSEQRKANADLVLKWEGKSADFNLKVDPNHIHLVSNVPEHGKYEVDATHKASEDGLTRETVVNALAKDKKLAYHSHYSMSRTQPFVDLNLELPQGKSRVYVKLDKKSDHNALVESQLVWFADGGGTLDASGEVNFNSVKDFLVKANIDSAKLNWNKIEFEAKSAGESVAFHGKAADKEISGNLALASKATLPNIHYEGKGELKVGSDAYPLEFKLKNEVNEGRKKESELDIKAGKYSLNSHTVMELEEKAKSYKMESTTKYCCDKGCKQNEIKVRSERNGYDLETSTDVKIEGIILKLEHPLIFKSHAKKQGWQYDGKVEASFGPEKLVLHDYIKEDRAGVELTLPKRVIATEVVYEWNRNKKPAAFKLEASFWLDKKQENDKTSLLIASESTKLPDGIQSSTEAKFSSPGLKEMSVKGDLTINTKDRTINGKLEADVFAKKNQKLVAEYKAVAKKEKDSYSANDNLHIHSKGLQVETQVERKVAVSKTSFSYTLSGFYTDSKQAKREAVAKLSVDTKAVSVLFKIPEATIISGDCALEKGDKLWHSKGKLEILGTKFEKDVELKGTVLKASIVQKTGNNPQLDLEVGFTQGQVAEVSGKFNKKSFASLQVALDEAHFLKTKHSYNTDVAKELVKQARESTVGLVKEGSKVAKETGAKLASEVNERVEIYRKALPNFKPAVEHYKKELQELKEEVTSNKNIKDGIDFLKNTFGVIFSQISAILHEVATTTEHLVGLLNEAVQKVTESVKATIPKLKESYEKAADIVIKILEDVLKQANTLLNIVLDKIKEHEKEIQDLTSIVTDSLAEIGQTFAKTFGELQKEVKDFINVLWDQLQTLPAYTMLKEKLQELKNFQIPPQYWESYHEVVNSAVNVLPTPELQTLAKSVTDYLEKIVKQEPFNKGEAIQQLGKEVVAALRSVIGILEGLKPEDKGSLPFSNFVLPIPTFSKLVIPSGTFRLSLLNILKSTDLPNLSEVFHTYRPTHSPIDILPPFHASAQLIGGTEFITFDRKHYSFKGSCSYILSTDIIDKNFTFVANIQGGKLKSLAALDHVNSVELLDDNTVLFNGKPAELPVHEGDLHMFRRYNDGTGFATQSGTMFFCTPNLQVCAFSINSFYFGKTRGLLGTYNYEPYDDTLLPDGKVAKSVAEFANAWKVSGQCADGSAQEQAAPQAEECTKLFTSASNLRGCFSFESPEKYRDACNKKVAEAAADAKQDAACNVAQAYVGYCYYVHFFPISLPDYCGKCQVGAQTLHIGESAQVTAPAKEADVVFVVEQLEENEEVFKNLVTPLISTLTNDFKEKGITDVNFGLLGFGAPDQKYPALYTFNGKVSGFSSPPQNIYFAKHPEVTEPKLSDRLEEIKKKLQIETGTTKGAVTMREAFKYPFRPEAARVVVGVIASSQNCERAVLPFQALRTIVGRLNLLSTGTVTHTIAPLTDLKLEGKDEKAAANIVGFDSNTVYMQSEAKKKVLKGDEDAFKNLKYTSDVCIDFTLGTNGAVFSASNFVKGKPNVRKNFLTVLSDKITESVTREELKKDCKCELERGMVVRTKCKVISRTEKGGK